ncbi:sphingomyelin phosphodiesterase related [Holotrichia oblita]|uniref:Sphingomyelin phosphodiesterase related n=1 Tax=Holotrichia oblita TaxID=644536 RepID=A0ACB9T6M9_HOLOL|nr:sphingomyelin phosphodiesterase related [Holotrichia oblita]
MVLKILTLNCWGLLVVAKDRAQRIRAIGEVLASSDYDVVCLQEVWLEKDFALLKEKAKGSLPYSHYFYSGVTGSGVCVLSKHQIQDVFFHQWSVNGYVHKIQHGDWFGGKGVGLCSLKINNFNINVYSAHLHAEYNRACDEYQAHRVLQAFHTAQFIQLTSGSSDLVILAGDLNTEPGDLAYRIILNIAGFKDSYLEVKDEDSPAPFGTNETSENSYTPRHLVKKGFIGKRIDYIMYHGSESINVILKNYCLPLPNRVPNCNYSYSDHEGIAAEFLLEKANDKKVYDNNADCVAILKESIQICNEALSNLKTTAIVYWFITALLFLLLVSSIPFDAPFGYRYVIHIVRGLLTIFLTFTFIMGSLWNKIESHGILSGRLAMEATLKKYESISK